MSKTTIEPVWTTALRQWWEGLLGPTLGQAWTAVKSTGSAPGMLVKAHGATVTSFESELEALGREASAFATAAAGTEWEPFAGLSLDVYGRVLGRWTDPKATTPLGVSGILDPVATVMKTVNTAVTAIGVAWAVASLAHVVHARRTLARWREHLGAGVSPSRRDTRRAGIEGDDIAGVKDWWSKKKAKMAAHRRERELNAFEHRKDLGEGGILQSINPFDAQSRDMRAGRRRVRDQFSGEDDVAYWSADQRVDYADLPRHGYDALSDGYVLPAGTVQDAAYPLSLPRSFHSRAV